jgi:hypothetical protein
MKVRLREGLNYHGLDIDDFQDEDEA